MRLPNAASGSLSMRSRSRGEGQGHHISELLTRKSLEARFDGTYLFPRNERAAGEGVSVPDDGGRHVLRECPLHVQRRPPDFGKELLAMRPRDPRYNAIALSGAPKTDASVTYVAMRSPISNTFTRYQNAERLKRSAMVKTIRLSLSLGRQSTKAIPKRSSIGTKRSPRFHSSSCRARWTTTCFRRYRRDSFGVTERQAAISSTSCSKVASTSGLPNRDHRLIALARW